MIFDTFFGICFISHLILRNKKCMTNSKKVRFLGFCPTLLNTKSFFQHFFYIFLTKKISIFNFPPHYNKFHLFCFLCSSYGKQLKNVKKVDLFSEKIKKIKIFLLFSKWIEKKINYAHHRAKKVVLGRLVHKVNRNGDIDIFLNIFPRMSIKEKKKIIIYNVVRNWEFFRQKNVKKMLKKTFFVE